MSWKSNTRRRNLHISCPKTHVSGFELTSTRTVGVQMRRTRRSAILKLVKKMFVEFRISFVFMMTMGTCWREWQKYFSQHLLHTASNISTATYHNVTNDAQTHNYYTKHHRRISDVGRNLWVSFADSAIDLHFEYVWGGDAASGESLWWRHRWRWWGAVGLSDMADGQADRLIEESRY